MPYKNKIALITGGSSGIGLATTRLLAAQGAHVGILSRSMEKLSAALPTIQAAKVDEQQKFGCYTADVMDAGQVAKAIEQITQEIGAPDMVINSAGMAHPGYVQELGLDIYRWMMDVNYFGTVYVTKAVLPAMLARRSGYIVNISSMAGFLGVFGYTAYGAAKYAVRGFSDALRAELKPLGIGVSVVFPPDTDTPELLYENQYKPMETKALSGNAKLMKAETVAQAILNGVEHRRYVILPGFDANLMYRLSNLLGNAVYPLMDTLIAQAQKQKGK